MWSSSRAYEHAFSINLLKFPTLADENAPEWLSIPDIASFHSEYLRLDEVKAEELPNLSNDIFQLDTSTVPLPDDESSADPSLVADSEDGSSSGKECSPDDEDGETPEDIWTLPEVTTITKANRLLGWETFLDTNNPEPRSIYLSEQIPEIFTLAWTGVSEAKPSIQIAEPDHLLSALRDLGLGRDSLFFSFDESSGEVESLPNPYTIPGLTVESFNTVIDQFKICGQRWRRLNAFVERGTTTIENDNSIVAFASCIQDILAEVLHFLLERPSIVDSLLQLQDVFQLSISLLLALDHLTSSFDILPPSLRSFLDRAEKLQVEVPTLTVVLEKVCQRVLHGSIRRLLSSVGLQPRQQDRSLTPENDCLTPEEAKMINGIQDAQEILESNDPGHSLLRCNSKRFNFELQFSFMELGSLQQDALEDEARLKDVVRRKGEASISPVLPAKDGMVVASTELSPWTFHHEDELGDGEHDSRFAKAGSRNRPSSLGFAVRTALVDPDTNIVSESIPPQEALSMSLRPILSAQHRLATFAVLDLLFDHHIDIHLSFLQRYSLFGDGLFANRLSHALFDPEQASGEGRRRDGGVTGLRLQSRETWPPASSELRLALMGILTESMISHHPTAHDTLLDSLSFSIRDLSDEEVDKCRDVDSIHALDFLRLHYKPPNTALEAIITPRILDKYDRIFKYLLRLLRLQNLAQQLLRQVSARHLARSTNNHQPDHRFRLLIQHFMSALASYSASTANLVPGSNLNLTSHVSKRRSFSVITKRPSHSRTAVSTLYDSYTNEQSTTSSVVCS